MVAVVAAQIVSGAQQVSAVQARAIAKQAYIYRLCHSEFRYPYTFLGLDLRAEPVVLTIPPIEKNRYWVFR